MNNRYVIIEVYASKSDRALGQNLLRVVICRSEKQHQRMTTRLVKRDLWLKHRKSGEELSAERAMLFLKWGE